MLRWLFRWLWPLYLLVAALAFSPMQGWLIEANASAGIVHLLTLGIALIVIPFTPASRMRRALSFLVTALLFLRYAQPVAALFASPSATPEVNVASFDPAVAPASDTLAGPGVLPAVPGYDFRLARNDGTLTILSRFPLERIGSDEELPDVLLGRVVTEGAQPLVAVFSLSAPFGASAYYHNRIALRRVLTILKHYQGPVAALGTFGGNIWSPLVSHFAASTDMRVVGAGVKTLVSDGLVFSRGGRSENPSHRTPKSFHKQAACG